MAFWLRQNFSHTLEKTNEGGIAIKLTHSRALAIALAARGVPRLTSSVNV